MRLLTRCAFTENWAQMIFGSGAELAGVVQVAR
jgi:hypothetical protein